MPRLRSTAPAAVLVVLALVLTGCGGSGGAKKKAEPSPTAVMATAKKTFDDASSVHISLQTSTVPKSGNAVLAADGDVTHDPAFAGTVKVLLSGFTATVPVTSVGGKVYAKLPLQTKYAVIKPSEYGAPDPADFASPTRGLSSLLTQLQGLKKQGQTRNGGDILTSYTGSLPGKAVKAVIPSASTGATYATTVGVDQQGRATSVKITGPFFTGAGDVTYDVAFSEYGKGVSVKAPTG